MTKGGSGKGSIYPRGVSKETGRDLGWAAYAWVQRPDGTYGREYVYGRTHDEAYSKWIKLKATAETEPIASGAETVAQYARYWLAEIVKPNLSQGTYDTYSGWVKRQIIPGIGSKSLTKLRVRDIQMWLNRVAANCQCCFQGKDSRRTVEDRQCCALELPKCCGDRYDKVSLQGLRRTVRAMLSCAIAEEKLSKNPASVVKIPKSRAKAKTKRQRRWSSEDARRFLLSARHDEDRYYPVYVWILVLGLRRGEALGISESDIDFDAQTLSIEYQIQRVGGQLLRNEVKTEDSDDPAVPLPDICISAARWRLAEKERERAAAGDAWHDSGLLMTTPFGSAVEPRNFDKVWNRRCDLAGVPRITRQAARRTCGSLLADLGVHPRVAMRILRHSKIGMTMEVYTDVSDEVTLEALRKLSKGLE